MRSSRIRVGTVVVLVASMLLAAVPRTDGEPEHRCDAAFCPARHRTSMGHHPRMEMTARHVHAGGVRSWTRSCPHHRGDAAEAQPATIPDCLIGNCDHAAGQIHLVVLGRPALLAGPLAIGSVTPIMAVPRELTQRPGAGHVLPSVPPPRQRHA